VGAAPSSAAPGRGPLFGYTHAHIVVGTSQLTTHSHVHNGAHSHEQPLGPSLFTPMAAAHPHAHAHGDDGDDGGGAPPLHPRHALLLKPAGAGGGVATVAAGGQGGAVAVDGAGSGLGAGGAVGIGGVAFDAQLARVVALETARQIESGVVPATRVRARSDPVNRYTPGLLQESRLAVMPPPGYYSKSSSMLLEGDSARTPMVGATAFSGPFSLSPFPLSPSVMSELSQDINASGSASRRSSSTSSASISTAVSSVAHVDGDERASPLMFQNGASASCNSVFSTPYFEDHASSSAVVAGAVPSAVTAQHHRDVQRRPSREHSWAHAFHPQSHQHEHEHEHGDDEGDHHDDDDDVHHHHDHHDRHDHHQHDLHDGDGHHHHSVQNAASDEAALNGAPKSASLHNRKSILSADLEDLVLTGQIGGDVATALGESDSLPVFRALHCEPRVGAAPAGH
jgi:hypothetical protein